jgi:hypothetical protein
MILTVLTATALLIAALGIIALGIALAARIQIQLIQSPRAGLTLGALILMALTVMCTELAAHGASPSSESLKLRSKQDWTLTLEQLRNIKAKAERKYSLVTK